MNYYDCTRNFLAEKLGHNVADDLSENAIMEIGALMFEQHLHDKELQDAHNDQTEVSDDINLDEYNEDEDVSFEPSSHFFVEPELLEEKQDETLAQFGNYGNLYILSKNMFKSVKNDIIPNADNVKDVKFMSKGDYIAIVDNEKSRGLNSRRLYVYAVLIVNLENGEILKEKDPNITENIFA